MSRWKTFCHRFLVIAAAVTVLGLPRLASAAPGDTLMDYGADLVSNYVWRGNDLYVSKFAKDNKQPAAFNVAPALQPSITFYGPGGLSFNMWGSFALTDRKPDTATSFAGLEQLDEIDYTLGWDWSNKMGGFSAGLVTYTLTAMPSLSATKEVYVSYAPAILPSISPKFTHYVSVDAVSPSAGGYGGSTYDLLSIGGGDKLTWSLSIGKTVTLNDITASVGYPVGPLSISLNVADRPNLPDGSTEKAAIFWIDINYSGSVKE
ncbi:MAG TPA: hypothetical protein VKB51_10535 [bacterium]|nr:hypothetical protein [bacterium]